MARVATQAAGDPQRKSVSALDRGRDLLEQNEVSRAIEVLEGAGEG
jgi:hypothetical protein